MALSPERQTLSPERQSARMSEINNFASTFDNADHTGHKWPQPQVMQQ